MWPWDWPAIGTIRRLERAVKWHTNKEAENAAAADMYRTALLDQEEVGKRLAEELSSASEHLADMTEKWEGQSERANKHMSENMMLRTRVQASADEASTNLEHAQRAIQGREENVRYIGQLREQHESMRMERNRARKGQAVAQRKAAELRKENTTLKATLDAAMQAKRDLDESWRNHEIEGWRHGVAVEQIREMEDQIASVTVNRDHLRKQLWEKDETIRRLETLLDGAVLRDPETGRLLPRDADGYEGNDGD